MITLTHGDLEVTLVEEFPQVVHTRFRGHPIQGNAGKAPRCVLVDDTPQPVDVHVGAVGAMEAVWHLDLPTLDASFDVVATVADAGLTIRLTNLADPHDRVHRVRFPDHDLISITEPDGQLMAAEISVDRTASGDHLECPGQPAGEHVGSWMIVASTGTVAIGLDTNAIEDNTVSPEHDKRPDNRRWLRIWREAEGTTRGCVSAGTWTWKGSTAGLGIGPDPEPYLRLAFTEDANGDGVVDWQDGAIALRGILPVPTAGPDVWRRVITRIPFNIVSQATHPFLRTLDDTKRVALATDGLGQQAMLKGYQSEGHDAAHPDYAGHYNERAGGLADLTTLVEAGEAWNTTFGVHVNATESYSESHHFCEELLQWPPRPWWNWMNQAYRIDGPRDLGSGAVVERLRQFRAEVPANLSWLYFDVYYPFGWEGRRLAEEVRRQGWQVGTEWSDRFLDGSVWSHWSNDEAYGGQERKGINSQLIRFVQNHVRDIFNPDPLLSNARLVEFEGWTGQHDFDTFLRNVWERNLPTKFLQRCPIVRWETGRIELADGTVVTSDVTAVDGALAPTQRTITHAGVTVYTDGAYLLPWTDGASRRYHWNPAGGLTTWQVPGETSLRLYRLADTGREFLRVLPVEDGAVTIDAEPGVAYVLYADEPAPVEPRWGEGTPFPDPGFNAGHLDGWQTWGAVSAERNDTGSRYVQMGPGACGIAAEIPVTAGCWSLSAWAEVEPSRERDVALRVIGGEPTTHQPTDDGHPATHLRFSPVPNATASDEYVGTHMQRMRVTFTMPADGTVRLEIAAGEGEARIIVDDLRLVSHVEPSDPAPTPETILFEDFEHVDQGDGPFVTGVGCAEGDARTQLAERHEPYSQRGWWAVTQESVKGNPITDRTATEGGKLVDNVLRGTWSLLTHEEGVGLFLRTTPTSIPLPGGHRYRVSFDVQTARPDTHALVWGTDVVTGESRELGRDVLPATTGTRRHVVEFEVPEGEGWFGFEALAEAVQADLVLDDLRVERLS